MKRKVFFISALLCCGLYFVGKQTARTEVQISVNTPAAAISRIAAASGSSRPVRTFSAGGQIAAAKTARPDVRETGSSLSQGPYPQPEIRDTDQAMARPSLVPMPTPSLSFEGLSNFDNIAAYSQVIMPPDMIGDVGPDHYVQAVNALVRMFDKSGNPLTPPFKMSQLFGPLGTPCSIRNDGEAVVLYDPLADRWLLSSYCNNFPPFRQMIAISKTGDPTGAWYVYEFVMPNIKLNDVSKFGVWPDAYYMSTEEFTGADFSGTGMFAFDRTKMLAGEASAAYIYFSRPSATTARLGNLLPADIDGLRPPPAGAPNVFVGYTATEYGDLQDAIRLFDFHADFANPSNSTFTERPESPLSVAGFDPTSPDGRTDITQPAPGDKLDANSDRLNYRAAYRNFGASESIVVNQTVRLSIDPYRAGVRLYELNRTGGAFSVKEQATIGNSTSSRWIGSAAQDNLGNLAVGYNHVADDRQPALRYTGKLAADPAGVFRDEGTLIDGTGVQKAFLWRWGDYSGMSVDPVDDCTFWMTGEYYTLESQNFSDFTWLTRIGRFKFDECTPAPRALINGSVTNAANSQPITGARVTAAGYTRYSDASGSFGNMAVVPGSYSLTATAHGFRPLSFLVDAANGQTLTRNFTLQPVAVLETVATQVSAESCGPNGAPDPGEVVTINVSLKNTGSIATQNLTATLVTGGGVTAPGPPQNYGALVPGGPGATRPFSFTVAPHQYCGDPIVMTLQLGDGAEGLGSVAISLQTGTPKIAFKENFDRNPQAQLPPRWTRGAFTVINSAVRVPEYSRNWTVSAKRSRSGTKSAFSPSPIHAGTNEMISPVFLVTSANARVTFQNWYELETTFLRNRLYDGSVLEIRMGDGPFIDILAAGGMFESGGYDGLIDGCCQNPLAGRPGWSGRSGPNAVPEFITTSARLPAAAAGQRVQLRWRVGTDVGIFREGQYIDDLLVTDGFVCGCTSARPAR